MRIPLDYYRILGLPIQATAEQLQQAYRDRSLQLPRREYSELAIAARKQLLDEAYAVLKDSEQRRAYDASFLSNNEARNFAPQQSDQLAESGTEVGASPTTADLDPHSPSLEIQNDQFVGALLILHELGEYELVLKLGRPYLSSGSSISLDKGRLGDPVLVRADIVLTLALACLELGREQWQQGQYENAALSLETGQELLLREALFPSVRGEIQADLYKLRPYRILELLALPEKNAVERRSGLQLLQDMLQERGGIDGTGDDQSGLTIDDFLRFIQQLRDYLTSAEQQVLFEAEARRPSAVATYLAVYALLARGFAQRHPELIRQAKQMLVRLGRRQDVHLEQSVCALLLGQTEEASRALELSQEYEPLAFIREHSQGAPDLLPGLCLYGERWLQVEVFPHFRDLAQERASLKDYFADEHVQAYLENLSDSSADTENEWPVVERRQVSYTSTNPSARVFDDSSSFRHSTNAGIKNTVPSRSAATGISSVGSQRQHSVSDSVVAPKGLGQLKDEPHTGKNAQSPERIDVDEPLAARYQRTATATLAVPAELEPSNRTQSLPAAERISKAPLEREQKETGFVRESSKRQRRLSKSKEQIDPRIAESGSKVRTHDWPPRLPGSRLQRDSAQFSVALKQRRLILLGLASIMGVAIAGFLLIGTYNWVQKTLKSFSAPALRGEQPIVRLDRPPVTIPTAESQLVTPRGPLNKETAKQVIQTWLSTKADALGQDREIDRLDQILAEPALSRWRKKAETDKKNNSYWQYKHSFDVKSTQTSTTNPDQATVEATVKEVAEFYEGEQRQSASSYNDNLRVRYDLLRKDGQWRIRDMAVLK